MQFYCPQGHLLDWPDAQMGQRSRCPHCGTEFVVPTIGQVPSGDPAERPAPKFVFRPPIGSGGGSAMPAVDDELPAVRRPGIVFSEIAGAVAAADSRAAPPEEERLLHIPCPAGHELEAPQSMIGQDVMCPHCRAEFRLQYRDSREFQAQQDEQRRRREQRIGRTWMTWSLVAAALVLFGVALMIALSIRD